MIAIIPAKGTSQRFPKKNMALLQDKPLLQWTIEVTQESGAFEEIIVSSDSEEIRAFADTWGVQVANRREALCTSMATVFSVCKDIFRVATGWRDGSFAVLLPTSPLRTAQDIRDAYELFDQSKADCLMSVVEYDYPPDWALIIGRHSGCLHARSVWCQTRPRQDLQQCYRHDGSIIMANTAAFLLVDDWLEMNPIPYFSAKERAVDINEPDDLLYAEFLLSQKGVV